MVKRAYCRTSSKDQNLARQLKAMEEQKVDIVYQEKLSGKDANRPELQRLLADLQAGDMVIIMELSRLGRSVFDLLKISKKITDAGATLVSLKENIDTSTSIGRLMFTMIGAIAEMERENILERQKEGIRAAKARGQIFGKPRQFDKATLQSEIEQGFSATEIANGYGIHVATVHRNIDHFGLKHTYNVAQKKRLKVFIENNKPVI